MSERRSAAMMCLAASIALFSHSQCSAASWVEDWETGYTTDGEQIKSPWSQAGAPVPMLARNWMAPYSGAWFVAQGGPASGVANASRLTGAQASDSDVVATARARNDGSGVFALALS